MGQGGAVRAGGWDGRAGGAGWCRVGGWGGEPGGGLAGWVGGGRAGMGRLKRTFIQPKRVYVLLVTAK